MVEHFVSKQSRGIAFSMREVRNFGVNNEDCFLNISLHHKIRAHECHRAPGLMSWFEICSSYYFSVLQIFAIIDMILVCWPRMGILLFGNLRDDQLIRCLASNTTST